MYARNKNGFMQVLCVKPTRSIFLSATDNTQCQPQHVNCTAGMELLSSITWIKIDRKMGLPLTVRCLSPLLGSNRSQGIGKVTSDLVLYSGNERGQIPKTHCSRNTDKLWKINVFLVLWQYALLLLLLYVSNFNWLKALIRDVSRAT